MIMLERIKRRQLEGFKEFVQNMETTGLQKRQQIITTGILEDPNYMFWVMKNMKTMDDVLGLPTGDLEMVLSSQEQVLKLFAKALYGLPQEQLDSTLNSLTRFSGQIKDELSYLTEVSPGERESARFYLVKAIRKLQDEEKLEGFGWRLPPMDIFYNKTFPDGRVEIYFESGILAAKGEMLKNRRTDRWEHFYDNGKILAQGHYVDGQKEGPWEFFFTNGQLRAIGNYHMDIRKGTWKEYDRSGSASEVEYKEGIRQD